MIFVIFGLYYRYERAENEAPDHMISHSNLITLPEKLSNAHTNSQISQSLVHLRYCSVECMY